MEKAAIDKIEDLVLAYKNAKPSETAEPIITLPRDMEIRSLEQYLDAPVRFRGLFKTSIMASFIDYFKAQEVVEAHTFIDSEKMLARTLFDIGSIVDPGHGDHNAYLELSKRPAYKALLTMNNELYKQRELIEKLQDWRDYFKPVNEDFNTIDIKKAISAIERIEIKAEASKEHAETDFSASRSELEKIEASGKNNALPAGFYFECVPYAGFKSRRFFLRMSLILTRDIPMLKLRIEQLEDIKQEIAQEFEELLSAQLESENVFIGTFAKVV